MRTCNILGTEYKIEKRKFKEDSLFEKEGCNGYCNWRIKNIILCDMKTYPGYEQENEETLKIIEKETLRHEIIHAFLDESGLVESTHRFKEGWSQNEEMIDWFAIQSPKIYKVFEELDIN